MHGMYSSRAQAALVLLCALCLAGALVSPPARAASPPIGMNLDGVDDWGPDYYFADAMKQARFWSNTNGSAAATVDSNGWPTEDAKVGVWYNSSFGAEGANPMNGTYALEFNGEAATISPSSGTISNQTYNSASNTTTATLTMTNNDLAITFTGTQRTSTSASNTGITNVQLMRPTTEGGSTPEPFGTLFMPQFVNDCKTFGVVRFMDYLQTVGNQSVNWSDRTPPTYWSQSSYAPYSPFPTPSPSWEFAVELCNAANVDAWINIPRFASNDYISKVAQLIKYGSNGSVPYTSTQSNPVYPPLNTNLHCYVEYSNENWNYTPGDLTAMGNQEIFGYPITTNGLAGSISNSPLSTVADYDNGMSGPPGDMPGNATPANPNYFRDVVFNSNTSVFTSQTPATTASDNSGGDELGMKFQSSTAGQITGVRFYKASGETGTHVGHFWQYGAPGGSQALWLWDNGGYAQQSLTFPTTGSYTVSYYASAVVGDKTPTVQFSVDGANVGSAITPGLGFTKFTSSSFTISTTGAHTIQLTNTEPSDTGRALISLVTVSGPGSVTVANNNFMSPAVTDGAVPLVQGASVWVWWICNSWTLGGGGAGLALNGLNGTFGTLLGTVTFSGETSSGWQEQNFTSPINIAANTTYMVSVNNNSTYAYTNSYQSGPLTWDGNMGDGYNRKWVERTVQISNIFRSVFGNSAMPGTSSNPEIRPVLMMVAGAGAGGGGGWIDNFTYTDLRYLQDYFNNQLALNAMPDNGITTAEPPSYYFFGGGGAPYYDPSGTYTVNSVWTTGDWATSNFTTDWLVGSANDGTAEYYVPQWGQYISYEGGPELPDNGTLSAAIWDSTNMEPLITNNQIAYNQNGGGLWVYFSLAGSYRWGFTTDMYNTTTPKMTGFSQINASTESAGTYGTSIPATLSAASTVPTYGAPTVSNMGASANHCDYAGYVVHVGTSSAFNISLSAGSSGTSNQANIYVDGVSQGTITIPNSGSDTTFVNTSTITTPTLAVGAHGIMVKDIAGSFGLSTIMVTTGSTTIPSAPTGLTAAAGNAQVFLAWNASSGATSYNIYRGTTSGGENGTAIVTGVATTTYINTGLTNGTTYYYKVAAVNSSGTSGMSNETSATPRTVPAAPTGLTPTPGVGQIALKWTTSSGATSYNVSRSTTSGTETLLSSGIATTSYTDTGLIAGITYYYTVSAVNSAGTSSASSQVSAAPLAVPLPIQINCGGPVVSPFVADTDFNGGTPYTNWTGAITTTGLSNPAPQAVYQSERYGAMTYTIPGLAASTTYTVRLHFCENYFTSSGSRVFDVAINGSTVLTNFDIFATTGAAHKATIQQFNEPANSSGQFVIVYTNVTNNALCNGIEIVTVSGAPAAPTGLTASAGNSQIALTWTAASGATSYDVYRGTTSGGEGATPIATGIASTAYTNTGLMDGTTYFYKVSAVNSSGTSAMSNESWADPYNPGVLLAQEEFTESTGILNGAGSSGNGWGAAWYTQNSDTTLPGYSIQSTSPLSYSGLAASGNHASGGRVGLTTGRMLDTSATGAFGSNGYVASGLIGASGKTLWLSMLLREDTSTVDGIYADTYNSSIAWEGSTPWSSALVTVGYFGAASQTGGAQYWSLMLGSTVYKSSVPITVGSTALMVAEITFGSTNTVNLYVNPTTLGGNPPGTPTLTETTTSSLACENFAWYAGGSAAMSSIDEIRFGTSYAAVTP